MRILLIDDNEALLETFSLMLSFDGHTVLTASHARDGLALLEAGEVVDLVLTDFNMPDISGLDVVRRVRLGWPGLRVGVITGSVDDLQGQEFDVFLSKPVNLPELLAAIRRLQ